MEEKEGERKNLSKENLRQRQGGWVDFPYQRSIIYHSKIRLSTCRTEMSKVSRYFSLTNQMVESSSNPTNRVHIISCVHYIVLMIISKRVTSAEGIYRKAILCITTITFSRRLCLLCPVGKLVVQVALHIAMELVYKNCQRHKGSKG